MKKLDRRDLLKTSYLTGLGVLTADRAWSLDTLEPVHDTLNTDYPYRGWEDVYRSRALARGITSYQDDPFTRDLHTIHDDYTMGGQVHRGRRAGACVQRPGRVLRQAKVVPTVRDDQVMMEHAWEPFQMRERKGLNTVATLIQPL